MNFLKRLFYVIAKLFFFIILKVYNRLHVSGRGFIPRGEKVIVVANHCSNMDPVVVGVAFPGSLRYLAKAELFYNPILGFLIKALGAIPVSKTNNQSAGVALKAFLEILESGSSVLLFPEGSRSFDGKLQPFQGGVALIALRSKVPIIPAYVSGTFEAMPRGAERVKPSKITVNFGEKISPEEIARDLPSKEARKILLDELEEAFVRMERLYGGKTGKV